MEHGLYVRRIGEQEELSDTEEHNRRPQSGMPVLRGVEKLRRLRCCGEVGQADMSIEQTECDKERQRDDAQRDIAWSRVRERA